MTDTVVHAAELEARAEYSPAASRFLTPTEQAELYALAAHSRDRLFFWGGYVGAERRAAVFLPEWAADGAPKPSLLSEEREEFLLSLIYESGAASELTDKICPVRISGAELTHRSVLGSLMALGIERDAIGDVTIDEGGAVIFTVPGIDRYVADELSRVGRSPVTVTPAYRDAPYVFERKFEDLSVTVASMRLDCVVAALCHLSRSQAEAAILRGDVLLSYEARKDTARTVTAGDVVTVRGYGKFRISGDGGLTRRERIRLNAQKYT